MHNAKEVVILADRYAKSIKDKNDDKEKDEFNAMMHNMGILSPVTKQSAGSQYHVELSKSLSTFLKVRTVVMDGACLFDLSPVLHVRDVH